LISVGCDLLVLRHCFAAVAAVAPVAGVAVLAAAVGCMSDSVYVDFRGGQNLLRG